ncbi:MAG: hypothetical protein HY921_04980 [Elusimicrobia bacterium]|nr:hypothetical protein [Elusimicrobiota bacterium]
MFKHPVLWGITIIALQSAAHANTNKCPDIAKTAIHRFKADRMAARAEKVWQDLNDPWPNTPGQRAWIGKEWEYFNREKPAFNQYVLDQEAARVAREVAALEIEITALCDEADDVNRREQTSLQRAKGAAANDEQTALSRVRDYQRQKAHVETLLNEKRTGDLVLRFDHVRSAAERLLQFIDAARKIPLGMTGTNAAHPNRGIEIAEGKRRTLLSRLEANARSLILEEAVSENALWQLRHSAAAARAILQQSIQNSINLEVLDKNQARAETFESLLSAARQDKERLWAVTDGEIILNHERGDRYYYRTSDEKAGVEASKAADEVIRAKKQAFEAQERLSAAQKKLEEYTKNYRRLSR